MLECTCYRGTRSPMLSCVGQVRAHAQSAWRWRIASSSDRRRGRLDRKDTQSNPTVSEPARVAPRPLPRVFPHGDARKVPARTTRSGHAFADTPLGQINRVSQRPHRLEPQWYVPDCMLPERLEPSSCVSPSLSPSSGRNAAGTSSPATGSICSPSRVSWVIGVISSVLLICSRLPTSPTRPIFVVAGDGRGPLRTTT